MKPSTSALLGLAVLVGLLAEAERLPAEPIPTKHDRRCSRCGGKASQRGRTAYCLKQKCGWFQVFPAAP